jgi:hypothetical protein
MTSPTARRNRQDREAGRRRPGLREFHRTAEQGGGVFETCVAPE